MTEPARTAESVADERPISGHVMCVCGYYVPTDWPHVLPTLRDRLFQAAAATDQTLKGGSIALPTTDRERRIYNHGVAVGIRTAAMELPFGGPDA